MTPFYKKSVPIPFTPRRQKAIEMALQERSINPIRHDSQKQ